MGKGEPGTRLQDDPNFTRKCLLNVIADLRSDLDALYLLAYEFFNESKEPRP